MPHDQFLTPATCFCVQITKAMHVTLDTSGSIPRLRFRNRETYMSTKTAEYDDQVIRLSMFRNSMVPRCRNPTFIAGGSQRALLPPSRFDCFADQKHASAMLAVGVVGLECNVADGHDLEESQAMKYLSWVLYPLVVGYGIYSLIYEPHKSWYSWLLNSLVGAVYTFGFILMCPQVCILPTHCWAMFTFINVPTAVPENAEARLVNGATCWFWHHI